MQNTTVTLDGYSTWQVGKEILDVKVTLGSQEKSSSCSILLADPTGKIADDLIRHSVDNGGIQALPGATPTHSGSTSTISTTGITSTTGGNGIVSSGGMFVPELQAFADLIAFKEVPKPLELQGYYSRNFSGYFPESETINQFPPSVGRTNVGRYQFNRGDWEDAKKMFPSIKGYTPQEQDLVMVFKMKYRKALQPLLAGDLRGAIRKAGYEWASLPESVLGQVQAGYTMQDGINYYQQRLAYYKGTTPVTPQAPVGTKELPKTGEELGTYKGRKLTISIGDNTYTYYHIGTKHDDSGRTEVRGQGVRYMLSRRRRNQSYTSTSLKKLAQEVATAHKVTLEWLAGEDYQYKHINQTSISDYQLLLRECQQVGLVLTETNLKLTIKGLKQLNPTSLVLCPGVNLISYTVTDEAIDLKKVDESGVSNQDNRKVTLDPLTGKLKVDGKDLDNVNKPDVTGRSSTKVSGYLEPGSTAKASQEVGKYKRVKALPSTFVLPISTDTLPLKPLDTIRTVNMSPTLNRIWLVDTVVHDVGKGTTEIKVTSAITTLDTTPNVSQISSLASVPPTSTGSYIIPCNGTVTSLQGYRVHPITGVRKMHAGVDIANAQGTQIVAADAGVVSFSGWQSGYGNIVILRHSSGETTRYAHNTDNKVRVGENVTRGQLIALMGSTGGSTGSHSHFEIRGADGSIRNPASYIAKLGKVSTSVLQGTN